MILINLLLKLKFLYYFVLGDAIYASSNIGGSSNNGIGIIGANGGDRSSGKTLPLSNSTLLRTGRTVSSRHLSRGSGMTSSSSASSNSNNNNVERNRDREHKEKEELLKDNRPTLLSLQNGKFCFCKISSLSLSKSKQSIVTLCLGFSLLLPVTQRMHTFLYEQPKRDTL